MTTSPAFDRWIDTFVDEKGIDVHHVFTKFAPQGTENWIPVDSVIAAMKVASKSEQAAIKTTLVRIDFANGDVLHFLDHLAGALAIDFAVVTA